MPEPSAEVERSFGKGKSSDEGEVPDLLPEVEEELRIIRSQLEFNDPSTNKKPTPDNEDDRPAV